MSDLMQEWFGTLRSLLNTPDWSYSNKLEFRALLRKAFELAPDIYQSQWLPYINGFASRFKDVWEITTDYSDITFEAFELCGKIEPFLKFRVSIYAETWAKIDLVEQILNSKYTHLIKRLSLSSEANISAQLAQVIANATGKTRLDSLSLRCCYFGDEGMQTLIGANIFEGVKTLDMSANHLGDLGIEALSQMSLESLDYLDVGSNQFGAPGAQALANMLMPALRSFDIRDNAIGDGGVEAIAKAAWMPQLQYLTMSECDFGDPGAIALSNVDFPEMRTLYLSENKITAHGFEALVTSTKLASVKDLYIERNQLGDRGAAAFADCVWTQLTGLNLGGNDIGDHGINQFMTSPALALMESLQLFENRITPIGVKDMVASRCFEHLTFLSLFHNKLTEQDIACFKQSSNFPVLREVRM